LIASQTVGGKLVALPYFTDAPALYYRKDMLDKYRQPLPRSLDEMAAIAETVMDGERAAGNADMWGYMFQAAPYEGLTSNGLEWIAANGGGQIIERDGTISVDNVRSILAVEEAETWVGTITPPEVIEFREEETRAVWLAGNAVFARDGFAAYALSEAADSKVRGKFAVMPPPRGPNGWQGAATLGGWAVAVSRYSDHRDEAIALAKFLASPETQKTYEAIALGHLPTITALYDDAEVLAAHPATALWKPILALGVLRPADQAGEAYPRISQAFWEAMQHSLRQDGFSEDYLQSYRYMLEWMQRDGWRRDAPRGPIVQGGAH
jgi:trehalose/maltose transport system substrate-binding protein